MYWHVSAKPFYLGNLFNYSMRIRKSVGLCLGKSTKFWVWLHYPHPPYFMSCGGKKSVGCMHLSMVHIIFMKLINFHNFNELVQNMDSVRISCWRWIKELVHDIDSVRISCWGGNNSMNLSKTLIVKGCWRGNNSMNLSKTLIVWGSAAEDESMNLSMTLIV